MSRPILIIVGEVALAGALSDSPTAQKLWEALPITGEARVWGDEVYFPVPVTDDQAADAREEMAVGELAYWPAGQAFCIFYGPTPASTGERPRAYSPVNVVGQIVGDARKLAGTQPGTPVKIIRSVV